MPQSRPDLYEKGGPARAASIAEKRKNYWVREILVACAAAGGAIWLGNAVVRNPDTALAIIVSVASAVGGVAILCRDADDRGFRVKLFTAALAARWLVGLAIHFSHYEVFFGGDATTYDYVGDALRLSWIGLPTMSASRLAGFTDIHTSGWGMYYYVAALYFILGRNPLAVQLINGVFGAAAALTAYRIARMVWPGLRACHWAGALVAFWPSMILWSSQGLKDAPIVLCLCLCTLYALKLRERLDGRSLVLLLLYLFCLFSLRHYVFYIVFIATAGTLVFAAVKLTPARVIQGGLLVVLIGVALAYLGAGSVSPATMSINQIQAARVWSASVSASGYGGDVDITDPQAALGFLPVGILYMLFAPFPWMIRNFRQSIALPEVIAWWAMAPLLGRGIWFALRKRLRETFPICVFTIGLTVAYALFQTNLGTAFRHRAQLYVFFFIYVAIGVDLYRAERQKRRSRVAQAPGLALGAPSAGLSL